MVGFQQIVQADNEKYFLAAWSWIIRMYSLSTINIDLLWHYLNYSEYYVNNNKGWYIIDKYIFHIELFHNETLC